MSKKTLIVIFLIGCSGFVSLFAQQITASDFELNLDYARFRGAQNLKLVEIYYAFYRDSVLHVNTGDKYLASYLTKLDISVQDSVIRSLEWRGQDLVNSLEDLKPNQTINDVYAILLGPGEFKVRVEVKDIASKKFGVNEIEFEVESQLADSLWMSDVQVGLQITPTQKQNRFVKNGHNRLDNFLMGKKRKLALSARYSPYFHNSVFSKTPFLGPYALFRGFLLPQYTDYSSDFQMFILLLNVPTVVQEII